VVAKTITNLPKPHKISLVAMVLFVGILIISPLFTADASRHAVVSDLQPGIAYSVPINLANATIDASVPEHYDTHLYEVKSGDSLAKIFTKYGISAATTYYVSQAKHAGKVLQRIMPGDMLQLAIDSRGVLQTLTYQPNDTNTLTVQRRTDTDYEAILTEAQTYTKLEFAQGTIATSFWHAGISAGLSDNKIMELADIFGWDIDFAMEIRTGDTFNVIYESVFSDGEYLGEGAIVAAEFVNQGESFIAIRHTDGSYYSDSGRSMKKSFLRAPVNFRYISSNFTKKRFHPVQKRWKAHRGVDYAAPVGTPVVAAGKGRVIKSAYDKYNGHHVFIQHGDRYVTKYLHFSKRTVKTGDTVKQGQVIGLLGASGMVTGAHLHYEFLVDGVHKNPRTVTLPKAEPIAKNEKAAFTALAEQRIIQLNNNKRIMLASLN
jgi:murein DD-endopeptidase MepM/ murein hydrolase activator NlpD